MATGKVTKSAVDAMAIPASGKRDYLWDDTVKGFGLMITDRGSRSYLLQYRVGGRGSPTRRVTIGKHGSPWTPDGARKRALELLEQVRRKVDPFEAARTTAAAIETEKVAAKAAKTASTKLAFSAVADRFVEKYAKVEQPKTWRATDSVIRRDLKPYFGARTIDTITAREIVELLDQVGERGASPAIGAYKALRVLLGFAVDRHLIATSPMASMKPPAQIASRDRALTDAELRLAWLAAGSLGYPFGPLIRMLILTGQRLREVAELPWVEIDTAKKTWLLPATRSKNDRPSLVPLTKPVLRIIDELPRIKSEGGHGDPLFAFTTTGDTPVSGFSKIKARMDATMLALARKEAADGGADERALAKVAVAPWRLHDLRRTLASGCQQLGVRLEVSEAILNHVSGTRGGIAGVYHVYKFEDEKRAALDAWARHLDSVVTGKSTENVIKMSRRV